MKTKRIIKKITVFLVLVAMVGIMLPNKVSAVTGDKSNDAWTDYVYRYDDFKVGTGTKDDPYQIATAEDLALLAVKVNSNIPGSDQNGKYFKLTADIDLSAHRWVPIGYGGLTSTPFSGYFDGNNHTITGMRVEETEKKVFAGLFGVISAKDNDDVSVKNLTIKNASVFVEGFDKNAYYGAGILAGMTTRTGGYNAQVIQIENCHVSGNVTASQYAGGLIGKASYLEILNSTAKIKINGRYMTGGFVGGDLCGKYENCSAIGTVESNGSGGSTGGFVGYITTTATKPATIQKCVADVTVLADNNNLGGFAGYINPNAKISNSVAYGDVSYTSFLIPKAGGFTGTNKGIVEKCHALNKVTASNTKYTAGGFVGGDDNGTTSECSFSTKRNPELNSVGHITNSGNNQISALDDKGVLKNICDDYYEKHEYSNDWIVDEDATCIEDGSKSKHCNRCDLIKDSQTIQALGHSFTNYVSNNDATCTSDGTKTAKCDRCNVTDTVSEKGSMLNHDYKEEWSSNDIKHWYDCKNCDSKKDEANHSFKWIIDKEVSTIENGAKHEECEICKYKKASVEIPALGTTPDNNKPNIDKDNVQTNDQINLGLYTSMLSMSGLFVIILAISRKKVLRNK